jgi:hypothetical protein
MDLRIRRISMMLRAGQLAYHQGRLGDGALWHPYYLHLATAACPHEPVTKSYEIQTLECPECESQVSLVQRTMGKCRPHRPVVQPYWRNVRIPGSAC